VTRADGAAPTLANLVKAQSHPLRVRILELLQDRVASPSELATALGARLGDVAYHIRKLHSYSCVRLVREEVRRNAFEHFYTSTLGGLRVIPAEVLELHADYVAAGLTLAAVAQRRGHTPAEVIALFDTYGLGLRPVDRAQEL
jgi:DNA-binding transcriptional ArsR family regulator